MNNKELYNKALDVLKVYVEREPQLEKLASHNIYNGVGFYINSGDIEERKLGKQPYFCVKLGGIDVTFSSGHLHQIAFANLDSPLQNIEAMLDDALALVSGDKVDVPVRKYEMKSGDSVVKGDHSHERCDPELRVKADMLDKLLGRKLAIDQE
jgi:hypothetical protein